MNLEEDFLYIARLILEGKEVPPKKDKEEKDEAPEGDEPDEAGPEELDVPAGKGDFKKQPKKPDMSKDPDKGGEAFSPDEDPDAEGDEEEESGDDLDKKGDLSSAKDGEGGVVPGAPEEGEEDIDLVDGSSKTKIDVNPKLHDTDHPDNSEPAESPGTDTATGDEDEDDKKEEKSPKDPASTEGDDKPKDNQDDGEDEEDEESEDDETEEKPSKAAEIGKKAKAKKDAKKPALKEEKDFVSSAHHSRMYRYHDQMARILERAIKKGSNSELRKQLDYHKRRCVHHTDQMSTDK